MIEPDSYFATLRSIGFALGESTSLTGIFLKLLAVLALVAANGYFVTSEFALVSVRRTKLEVRAAGGSKQARAALRLLDNPTLFHVFAYRIW